MNIKIIKEIIKNNPKMVIGMVSTLIVFVVLVCGGWWLSTDTGYEVMSCLVKNFPFMKFIFKTGTGILKIRVEEPDFKVSSVAVSLSKMMVSTELKACIFFVVNYVVNYIIGVFDAARKAASVAGTTVNPSLARSLMIDRMDKIENSFLYIIFKIILTIAAATLSELMVTKLLFEKFQGFFDSLGGQTTLFISVIVCLALLLVRSYIFAAREKCGITSGVILALFFVIIPELFSLFCVNVFYFLVYLMAGGGVNGKLVLCTLVLLVLIALWEELSKKLQAWCVGYLRSEQKKATDYMSLREFIGSFFTVLPVLLSFYLMYFTMVQMGNPDRYFKTVFLKFPLFEALLSNVSISNLLASGSEHAAVILFVQLFLVTLISVYMLRSKVAPNIFLWAIFWCSVVMTVDLFGSFVIGWAMSSAYEPIIACVFGIFVLLLFLRNPMRVLLSVVLTAAVFIIYGVAWQLGGIAVLNEEWLSEIAYFPILCAGIGLLFIGGLVKKIA